jgi:hypothetical protein
MILVVVPLAVAGGLVAAVLRPYALLLLLCLVPLNGFPIPVGATNVRADQTLSALMVIGLGLSALFVGRRLYIDRPLLALMVLLGLNAVTTAFVSPSLGYSATQVVNLTATWAIYAVIVNCVETAEAADRVTAVYLWVMALAAVIGIAAFAAGIAGFPIGMANVEGNPLDIGQPYGAFGTAVEPNIFGSMCQSAFVAAAAMLLLGQRDEPPFRRSYLWAILVVSGLGLLLSFTRGAWVGTMCGLLAVVVLAPVIGRRVSLVPLALPSVAAALGITWLWTSDGPAGVFFRYKVNNLFNPQSETATFRLVSYGLAWAQILEKPIFGWGTFTYAALLAQGSDVKELGVEHSLWIGNYVLLILHDTGIVGLLVFAALIVAVLRIGRHAARSLIAPRPQSAIAVLSLVASLCGLLVSFLASSGFTFTYPWVVIGLIGAYGRSTAVNPRDLRYSS